MKTFTLFAYGYHAIGVPNFDHTGFGLFTDGWTGLFWTRVGGYPISGEIDKSDSEPHTAKLREIFEESQRSAIETYNRSKPIGISPVKTGTFQFQGTVLNDFADHLLGNDFQEFAKYIGMPNGVVQKAAKHICRVN